MSIIDRFKKDKEKVGKKSLAPALDVKKETTSVKEKSTKDSKAVEKKAPKKEVKKVAKKAVTSLSKAATSTILAPVVSEKSAHLADRNVLVFKVAKKANRIQVRNAFRELYKVTPLRVNIINVRGARVRFGRTRGKQSDWKKAMIFLPKGTNVDIFEGV